jgi:hypothetical protein
MSETVKVNKEKTTEPVFTATPSTGIFPTNIVELPSGGRFYPDGHPLSAGTVEMKFMTAKEENILTTESYIKSGVVIDKFLQSMIISPKFNYDDLLIGDRDGLMIASRIYGYGEIYPIEVTAPSGRKQKVDIDLTTLENKVIPDTLNSRENRFSWTFENKVGKYTIEFKLLTVGDDKIIQDKLKKYRAAGSADRQITTRLEQIILSVNGNSDPMYIKLFVENEFMASDSRKFREYVASITPGVNMEIELEDTDTGEPFRTSATIGPSFFWPDSGL